MSLAKQVKKLNLESENTSFIDEEVVAAQEALQNLLKGKEFGFKCAFEISKTKWR